MLLKLICITVVLLSASQCHAFTMGLYFDEYGANTCLDTPGRNPRTYTAYVIVKGLGATSGIEAWEAKIFCDASLSLTEGAIGGEGTNATSFPSYQVTLPRPLDGDLIVLAEFTVTAHGEGSLSLTGLTTPTIPGLLVPACTIAGTNGILMPAEFEYGGCRQPVAAIGNRRCPQKPGPNIRSDFPTLRDAVLTTLDEPIFVNYSMTYDDISRLSHSISLTSDACFVGELTESRPGIYESHLNQTSYFGAAMCTYRVIEPLWGLDCEYVDVLALGADVPGWLTYDRKRLPDLSHFALGRKHLVTSSQEYGVLVARAHSITEASTEHGSGQAGVAGDLESVARSYRDDMRIDDAFRHADLIVCARLADAFLSLQPTNGSLIDLEVFQGTNTLDRITIQHCCDDQQCDDRERNIKLYPAITYLFALRSCESGHYSIVNGARGILRYQDYGLTTLSGHDDPAIADIWTAGDGVEH
ncbi:MAG: hypothetical protein IPM94_14545 [bacterium]|nr:hypothetical protein [bacterium]